MSVLRLSASDLGRRVVVRRLLTGGGATDVVGELLSIEADVVRVLPDDGPAVAVPVADVVAAKAVPPRRVTPSSSPDALERVMLAGWPGLHSERLGGWVLRASGGFTRRANSALVVGNPGMPLEQALDVVRTFYDRLGLRPAVQVPVPLTDDRRWRDPRLLAAVEGQGWSADSGTDVMTLDLRRGGAGEAASLPAGAVLGWADEPDDDWLALYRYHGSALPPVARDVLLAARHQAFASVRGDGGTVAVGRVAVAFGWVGITAMQVAEEQQRHGIARALLAGMLERGRSDGARFAYLQVLSDNAPAIALYSSAGFAPHHRYLYLGPPDIAR
ncbi:MAG: GNAT family N-acetyltransferase [Actinomycetes bacterium]